MDHYQKLWELQQLDHQIDQYQKAIAAIHRTPELLKLNLEKKSVEQQAIEEANKLATQKKDMRKAESDLKILNEHLIEIDQQMYSNQNKGRELQYIMQDKDHHVALGKQLEDQIIALIEQSEQTQSTLKQIKSQIELKKKEWITLCAKLNSEIKLVEVESQKYHNVRDKLADQINKKLYKEYLLKKDRLNGMLVATVDQNQICTGCHVYLSQRIYKAVEANKKVRCEECGRYLIHQETVNKI